MPGGRLMLSKEQRIIKPNQYTYDLDKFELAAVPQKAPYTTIIKRYQIDYSYEQKYKLGIITAAEFMVWQSELAQKASEDEKTPHKNHTFWEDDEGVRENVSNAEYDNFLAQNQIDVSNTTSFDFDALIREQEQAANEVPQAPEPEPEPEPPAPPDVDAILDKLPGDDDPNRVLTTEEIQALFAAMGTN